MGRNDSAGGEQGASRAERTGPDNWLDIVLDDMDFEAAYTALDGYSHFHTSTLRGKICMLQNRTEESWLHFEKAEDLYESLKKRQERDELLFFYQRTYKFDNACYEEAVSPSAESRRRTDLMLRDLLEFTCPDARVLDQIRLFSIANFQLMRGEYRTALMIFEELLDESTDRLEDQRIGFFLGAAAAAGEIDLGDVAERHYQNAALTTNLVDQNFKCALFYSRLYTLLTHWNRPDEAEDWEVRLRRLEVPVASKEYFLRRAKYLTTAAREENLIYLC